MVEHFQAELDHIERFYRKMWIFNNNCIFKFLMFQEHDEEWRKKIKLENFRSYNSQWLEKVGYHLSWDDKDHFDYSKDMEKLSFTAGTGKIPIIRGGNDTRFWFWWIFSLPCVVLSRWDPLCGQIRQPGQPEQRPERSRTLRR